jgi:hypothetical protein
MKNSVKSFVLALISVGLFGGLAFVGVSAATAAPAPATATAAHPDGTGRGGCC